MFARQMGKNETSAQLEAYLMALHARRGGCIVKAAPSFKPQVINSILRLKATLRSNPLTRKRWKSAFERLGEQHPSIQTQYLLRCMSDAGRLFSAEQRAALAGTHPRQRGPVDGCVYVAGIDVAGEDEQAEDAQARLLSPKRDSTVVTIAEVTRDANGSAVARVVEHVWWTGRNQVWQFENLVQLWERWCFARASVDASGIGAGLAAFLEDRFAERVEKVIFTAPTKSQLAYRLLAMTNTRRISLYKEDRFLADGVPGGVEEPFDVGRPSVTGFGWDAGAACSPEAREFWTEIRACRYWMRAAEQMGWGVPESEGHDHFVVSLALVCCAAEDLIPPAAGILIRSKPDHEQQEW